MATGTNTLAFFVDQLNGAALGLVTTKKMFGEYGLYLDGLMFALACDDRLFLKTKTMPDQLVNTLFGNRAPAYPGATGTSELAPDVLEDSEKLRVVLQATLVSLRALPAKLKRKP
jgi:TfoX/Sxy family transcriptional regulator of competence genes